MKCNLWTAGLAAAGVISLTSVAQAEEAQHQVMTALSSTTLSGYVDTSAIWKFGTDRGGSVLPGRSFDRADKQDGFNLNVVKLSIEKPLTEGNWAAGYKADLLFGPDANLYGTSSPLADGTGDFAVKQAYVSLQVPVGNGLTFKAGVWDTIIGYEVFDSANNPNYSRSYGFFLEPFAHTGLLASYRVNDWLSVAGGVADASGAGHGVRNTINSRSSFAESIKSYMGSIVLTAPESMGFLEGSTLYAGVIDNGKTSSGTTDVINIYAGATVNTPVKGLRAGAAYDYRGNSADKEVGWPSAYANAASLYASYDVTEKLTAHVRGEYAWASAGTFGAKSVGGSHDEKLMGLTGTVDYKLWGESVLSRLEFRWDHDASGGPAAFGGLGTTMAGGGAVLGSPSGTYDGYLPQIYSSDGWYYVSRGADANYLKNAYSVAVNIVYKF